ncbi:hypothetical protein NDU88_002461 [Pleurodeles waltl]|uniref:Uncharacterized protein n=1 Tax=Pleurodeles waltl TaxID=8319 RepID=A0AAV7T3I2_PLEWA|nr:hypothetical protein NDU88_002461 [Pleurodeles waltl]
MEGRIKELLPHTRRKGSLSLPLASGPPSLYQDIVNDVDQSVEYHDPVAAVRKETYFSTITWSAFIVNEICTYAPVLKEIIFPVWQRCCAPVLIQDARREQFFALTSGSETQELSDAILSNPMSVPS